MFDPEFMAPEDLAAVERRLPPARREVRSSHSIAADQHIGRSTLYPPAPGVIPHLHVVPAPMPIRCLLRAGEGRIKNVRFSVCRQPPGLLASGAQTGCRDFHVVASDGRQPLTSCDSP